MRLQNRAKEGIFLSLEVPPMEASEEFHVEGDCCQPKVSKARYFLLRLNEFGA